MIHAAAVLRARSPSSREALLVRIEAQNFAVGLRFKDGVIVEADRPVRYMRGWTLARVIALADRWHWKIRFTDVEQAQIEQESSRR